jgi:hypothetical protein
MTDNKREREVILLVLLTTDKERKECDKTGA